MVPVASGQKMMLPINDLTDISKYSWEWILINGVQLTDLWQTAREWYDSDDGEGFTYSWSLSVHFKGKICFGSYKTSQEKIDVSKISDREEEYLIIGKISTTGIGITKLEAMKALLPNTEYSEKDLF